MPYCHWVLIAWLWLGYMHCITKCWVSHARVKSIVVTPKFSLVWPCHNVFHNLPCFRFGLFLVETYIHYVMPSMLFSFITHWYFSSCLKFFHPQKRNDMFSYTSYYDMSGMQVLCAAHYIWVFWSSKFMVILYIYQFALH